MDVPHGDGAPKTWKTRYDAGLRAGPSPGAVRVRSLDPDSTNRPLAAR